jgi:hypothetical protein
MPIRLRHLGIVPQTPLERLRPPLALLVRGESLSKFKPALVVTCTPRVESCPEYDMHDCRVLQVLHMQYESCYWAEIRQVI